MSNPEDPTSGGTQQQPAADPNAASTSAPASPDSCAQIPAAAHVVLEAEIKLLVQIPRSAADAQQMPHKFTLTSDDGSVNVTLPASSAVAGDVDGTAIVTFTGLAEHHSYTLQCDNGSSPVYTIFQGVPYETIGDDDGSQDSTPPYGDSSSGAPYDNGINPQ
jgi:hypothetical protein